MLETLALLTAIRLAEPVVVPARTVTYYVRRGHRPRRVRRAAPPQPEPEYVGTRPPVRVIPLPGRVGPAPFGHTFLERWQPLIETRRER